MVNQYVEEMLLDQCSALLFKSFSVTKNKIGSQAAAAGLVGIAIDKVQK